MRGGRATTLLGFAPANAACTDGDELKDGSF